MQIEKRQPDVIATAIREGILNISRTKATVGEQILLAPVGWKPGDDLVAVKITSVTDNVVVATDSDNDTWAFWL